MGAAKPKRGASAKEDGGSGKKASRSRSREKAKK